jgi:hypothetical protein
MKDEGGILGVWKERGIFVLAAAALVAYSAWLVLSQGSRDAEAFGIHEQGSGRDRTDQRYVPRHRTFALPVALYDDADALFAKGEPDAYWGGSLRRVWVKPRVEKPKEVLRLPPPPPTIPAPVMLLPVPGPTLGFTGALPRWPEPPPSRVVRTTQLTRPGFEPGVDEEEDGGKEAPFSDLWRGLRTGKRYRIFASVKVMSKHMDDMLGNEPSRLLESAEILEGEERGVEVLVLKVRPTRTGTPWYQVRHKRVEGWVNGITLKGKRIERVRP